jgi:hypothetical protein
MYVTHIFIPIFTDLYASFRISSGHFRTFSASSRIFTHLYGSLRISSRIFTHLLRIFTHL